MFHRDIIRHLPAACVFRVNVANRGARAWDTLPSRQIRRLRLSLGGWGLAVLDPSHPPPKSHTAGRASSGTRLRTLANPSGTRREKCSDGEFVGLGGKTTALHESQSDVIYFGCSPHPDPLPGVPGRGRHAADRWRIRRLGRGYDLGARGARSQPPAAQIAHCWTSQQWHTITHTSQPQWHTIRHHPETTTPGGSCDTSGAVVILTVCVSP